MSEQPPDSLLSRALDQPEAGMQHVLDAANEISQDLLSISQDEKSGLGTEKKWRDDLRSTIEGLDESDELLVMVGDLNGFKTVNDALGHSAGDELLGIVGQALSRTFRRESDHVARGNRDTSSETLRNSIARLGGDEFALFSVTKHQDTPEDKRHTDNSTQTTALHSERINSTIQELVKGTKFEEYGVSIAIGGVEYNPDLDRSPDDVFVRADAKMYEIKYRDKLDNISPEDIDVLRKIIPYLKGLGARVEPWLEDAAFKELAE